MGSVTRHLGLLCAWIHHLKCSISASADLEVDEQSSQFTVITLLLCHAIVVSAI